MVNDVIVNKLQTIKRCLQRIKDEYDNTPTNLENFTKQDAIILNIQRACEACLDLAMHIISEKQWGIPQTSRDAFEILHHNGVIESELAVKLKAMVGFRNIAVHDYQSIHLPILQAIIEQHLEDFVEFSDVVFRFASQKM
ncbi:DUF86 domain-containing protein [Aneurinibacillus sp. Ricciae_BoGa-3]|uniref:type VII toxin-antitoxin system HepT family RNase toxin n=1 Tax=Aneurinibacillus sp. Ricciae_BoGa-3 TaxID=3022697 RepID=UPI0023422F19|nr:DUF86 domain-containing protein [Aneurinibacillus sp. Ricciae_BoGa-3]WCK56820.1 DUF86 domain-containing protein [Aneurinibacillus sp. Ricciae_BoGa-3]